MEEDDWEDYLSEAVAKITSDCKGRIERGVCVLPSYKKWFKFALVSGFFYAFSFAFLFMLLLFLKVSEAPSLIFNFFTIVLSPMLALIVFTTAFIGWVFTVMLLSWIKGGYSMSLKSVFMLMLFISVVLSLISFNVFILAVGVASIGFSSLTTTFLSKKGVDIKL
jgi:hypothetical protein